MDILDLFGQLEALAHSQTETNLFPGLKHVVIGIGTPSRRDTFTVFKISNEGVRVRSAFQGADIDLQCTATHRDIL